MWDIIKFLLTLLPPFIFVWTNLTEVKDIIQQRHVSDLSLWTYYAFFIGNIGAYLLTEKYYDLRAIVAYLFTAISDIIVIHYMEVEEELHQYKNISVVILTLIVLLVVYLVIFHHDKLSTISNVVGIVPAIILPFGALMQLTKTFQLGDIDLIDCQSWFLGGLADFGAYFLAEKYNDIKAISAFLLTGILAVSVAFTYMYRLGPQWYSCIALPMKGQGPSPLK